MRDQYTIQEGDRLWPLIQMVRNTYIDDLTDARIQELVEMVDSWRVTDAEGRLLPPRRTRP